jgi:hypothetical protein
VEGDLCVEVREGETKKRPTANRSGSKFRQDARLLGRIRSGPPPSSYHLTPHAPTWVNCLPYTMPIGNWPIHDEVGFVQPATRARAEGQRLVCFAGTSYRVGSKLRRRQVQVAVVGGTVEISIGSELIRSHPTSRPDARARPLTNPGGRPLASMPPNPHRSVA